MKYYINCIFISMRAFGIFVLLFFSLKSIAQQKSYYQKIREVADKGKFTIDSKQLIGKWVSMDSITDTLHFKNVNSFVELQFINGKKFTITNFKNLAKKSVLGTLARWPSEHCIIEILGTTQINVEILSVYPTIGKRIYEKL